MLSPSEEIILDRPEKLDENHNSYENANVPEPVMKISSCKNLQSVGVINVPSYEEKIASIDLSDEFSFSSSQRESSTTENSLENSDIRELSKKYLSSLVRNSQKQPYIINNFSTPPISIQENSPTSSEYKLSLTQPKSLCLFKDTTNLSPIKSQSCLDISSDSEIQNTFLSKEYPTLKEKKLVSQFMKSVPNLQNCDESLRLDKTSPNKSIISDYEEFEEKPCVKNLRKLFDKKENKVNTVEYFKDICSRIFKNYVLFL